MSFGPLAVGIIVLLCNSSSVSWLLIYFKFYAAGWAHILSKSIGCCPVSFSGLELQNLSPLHFYPALTSRLQSLASSSHPFAGQIVPKLACNHVSWLSIDATLITW